MIYRVMSWESCDGLMRAAMLLLQMLLRSPSSLTPKNMFRVNDRGKLGAYIPWTLLLYSLHVY